jgi:hypothetical protein
MIESLYFSCYYAYLRGNLEQAQMYYSILKEEVKITGFKNSLNSRQLLELKKIKDALKSGSISKNTWLDEPNATGTPALPAATIRQDELVKQIHTQGLDQLKTILQDDLYLYNIEHPCGDYGSVDMVYMGKETVYPLEVKKDQGKHDLIGQLNKYDLYHKFFLHYKLYADVQSVAICGSYEPYTLKELKQLKFKTILYSTHDDHLQLKEI